MKLAFAIRAMLTLIALNIPPRPMSPASQTVTVMDCVSTIRAIVTSVGLGARVKSILVSDSIVLVQTALPRIL